MTPAPAREPSFQERMKHNDCWGCGPHNAAGLRLASHWQGEEAVAVFTPARDHKAGPPHVVNGGILATILDCHGVCTAWADAYRREGRTPGDPPDLWYATAKLAVDYLKPAPIDRPLHLAARVVERTARKTVLALVARSGGAAGEEVARAQVIAVRVPPAWLVPPEGFVEAW